MNDFLDYSEIQQQAIAHAHKLAQPHIKKGYTFEHLFTYTDAENAPLYWKLRLKNYVTGDKWIRAFSSGERGFELKEPQFSTVYPQGLGKKPLYALAQISKAPQDAEVWLFEGEQKADLAQDLGVYASTCGGSNTIDATDLAPLQGRNIVIWRDNDRAGLECQNNLALKLHQLDCKIQLIDLEPLELPAKGDIVDWLNIRNSQAQRTAVSDLQQLKRHTYTPPKPSNTLPDGVLAEPMEWERGHFEITDKGIFYIEQSKSGDSIEHYISTPVLVLADTRDNTSSNWGRLLKWWDRDEVLHEWAVPMELFQTDGVELRKILASNGVRIGSNRRVRELFQMYLSCYPTDKMATCVDRVGWHDDVFVLPNAVIGQPRNDELVVYQAMQGLDSRYTKQGTLEQWQKEVSALAQSHSKLVFALSTAFAGQLLTPLEQQGAGVHYRGTSSKGKTTAIHLGCSVWGKPRRFYRTWRATGNALEHTAFMHNDSFLALDEIGEIANPKELGNLAYSLSNGLGKARMSRHLTAKASCDWRVIFLSSGEENLKEIMEQNGQKTKLGQEIRMLDIDVDQSQYGIFDQVDFAQDGANQSRLLVERSNQYYGTAGVAWLEYLTSNKVIIAADSKDLLKQYRIDLSHGYKEGHIERVANSFALIAVAGELATQAGITGWQQGRAFEATQTVFKLWLSNFEQVGDFEDRHILQSVRSFFEANGNARFDTMQQGRITPTEYPEMNEGVDSHQNIRAKTLYRVGFRQLDTQGKLIAYLVHSQQFKDVICNGLDPKKVAKTLVKHKWLEHEQGKSTKPVRGIETKKPVRMYVFNESVFTYDIEQATNPHTQPQDTGKTVEI